MIAIFRPKRLKTLEDLAAKAEEEFGMDIDLTWHQSRTTSRVKWIKTDNFGYVSIDHIIRFAEAIGGVNVYMADGHVCKVSTPLDEFVKMITGVT